jgi:hypothetical protein
MVHAGLCALTFGCSSIEAVIENINNIAIEIITNLFF